MARSSRTHYGHPFSGVGRPVAFRGATAMRGPRFAERGVAAMPHPENRLPAKVAPDLIQARVWELIESGVRIRISCDNCSHETLWTRGFMEKRLNRLRGLTMIRLAVRLRCGGCRSSYIHVWRA